MVLIRDSHITIRLDMLREACVDSEHFRYENIVGDVHEVEKRIHVGVLDEMLSRL